MPISNQCAVTQRSSDSHLVFHSINHFICLLFFFENTLILFALLKKLQFVTLMFWIIRCERRKKNKCFDLQYYSVIIVEYSVPTLVINYFEHAHEKMRMYLSSFKNVQRKSSSLFEAATNENHYTNYSNLSKNFFSYNFTDEITSHGDIKFRARQKK